MQELKFTTTVDDKGNPDSYTVEGTVTLEGESVTVGLYTTNFNKAFDELIYWLHAVESDASNVSVNVRFNTSEEACQALTLQPSTTTESKA
jgi:hypothetical protein